MSYTQFVDAAKTVAAAVKSAAETYRMDAETRRASVLLDAAAWRLDDGNSIYFRTKDTRKALLDAADEILN